MMCDLPTIQGFQTFLTSVVGIDPAYLPVSPVPGIVTFAYNMGCRQVNQALWASGVYKEALYCYAASVVINAAPDQAGRTYFEDLRTKLNISKFAPGVVASSADQSTSEILLNPEVMKNLSIGDLQLLKDPWGRQYLSLTQNYGTAWTLR